MTLREELQKKSHAEIVAMAVIVNSLIYPTTELVRLELTHADYYSTLSAHMVNKKKNREVVQSYRFWGSNLKELPECCKIISEEMPNIEIEGVECIEN